MSATAIVTEDRLQVRVASGRLLRKLHLWTGILCTPAFVLLLATGLLVQHREAFGLERRTVSRKWLPAGYRPQDPDTEIRADIVLTDLHSGRIFGARGPLLVDSAAAGWLLMMASGYGIKLFCRCRNNNCRNKQTN